VASSISGRLLGLYAGLPLKCSKMHRPTQNVTLSAMLIALHTVTVIPKKCLKIELKSVEDTRSFSQNCALYGNVRSSAVVDIYASRDLGLNVTLTGLSGVIRVFNTGCSSSPLYSSAKLTTICNKQIKSLR